MKPYDRGVHFSSSMPQPAFDSLVATLAFPPAEAGFPEPTDFDKFALLASAAALNYFTPRQTAVLLGLISQQSKKARNHPSA